ncbi:MAG: sigma-70 family RNA polymerase sigma factor [Prevotellaceae bacterium]|jgi:RNA polymerase sigma-70 factor (ECF subfamily)|nr:sigma-70 family RNA polymerase sigma factor [Prevotellaceae bacterium]
MKQQNLLWDNIRKGDINAFTKMYNLYYRALFVYGYKICGDKNLVKDVLHELFLELWVGRQRFIIKSLPQYLHTVLKRKIIKLLSSSSNVNNGNIDEIHQPSYEELLIGLQTEEEVQQKLQKALKRLTPQQMNIIKMKFFENKSYEEIARYTDTTPRTIYNQVYEALKILRKYIRFILYVFIMLNFNN